VTESLDPAGKQGPSPGARILAYLLLFLGGAWILLSGGCTLVFMTMAAGGFGGGSKDMASIGVFLGIGAVCILPGLGLFFGGWVILRKPKPPKPVA
jgi:hypothetical protein